MAYDDFHAIRVVLDGGIARVTLDHPPINLLDLELIGPSWPIPESGS
jgi:hypothetical protein